MRIETTQLYAKVTDRKVDEDMKRLKAAGMDRTFGLYEEEVIVKKDTNCPTTKKRPCKEAVSFTFASYPSLFFPASFICVVKNFLYV